MNKKELLEKIGLRIRKFREEKGLEIKQVASDLHISPQALSQIEYGKSDISISRISAIAEILQVSFNEILAVENGTSYSYNANQNTGGCYPQVQNFTGSSIYTSETPVSLIESLCRQIDNQSLLIKTMLEQFNKNR